MVSAISNWRNERPKSYYPECIKMFGKPTFVANVKDGYALWKTRGLFSQHLLIDEEVKHCVPRVHYDYFYSSVKFFIPKDKVCDVLKISGSLNYDGLKKELTARCGAIGANYATLYLGMLVASGKMTISQVKKNDMYPRMIQGKILPHKKMAAKMRELKKKNNKKYSKELDYEFATYAYSKCYKPKSKTKKRKTHKKRKGGPKKAGLAVTWGRNVAMLSRSNCGIRRANLCPPQIRCCPSLIGGSTCPDFLNRKYANFVAPNHYGQTTGSSGRSSLFVWR